MSYLRMVRTEAVNTLSKSIDEHGYLHPAEVLVCPYLGQWHW